LTGYSRWLSSTLVFILFSGALLSGMRLVAASDHEEEKSRVAGQITLDEDGSTGDFGQGNYTTAGTEHDQDEHQVEAGDGERASGLTDAQKGSLGTTEAREEEEHEEERPQVSPEILRAATESLIEHFGERNYTVKEAELEEGAYEIEMRDNEGGEYEVKVDAATGKVIGLEGETSDLKVAVEEEDEEGLKVEIREGRGFNVGVDRNEPKLKLEFKSKENVTESELDLELLFDQLTEYLDNGTSPGVFDPGDTVLAATRLGELNWSVMRSEQSSENGSITSLNITQSGEGGRVGNLTFVYHLTPRSRTVALTNETARTVRIWAVKFDVHIEDYNWASNDSSLALSGRFNAEFEVELRQEKEVEFKRVGEITPFFNWGGEAFADGRSIDVNASVSRNRLVLSYPHFNASLAHDPRIGYLIHGLSIEVLAPLGLIAGAAILATIMAAAVVLSSRRMREQVLRLPVSLLRGVR